MHTCWLIWYDMIWCMIYDMIYDIWYAMIRYDMIYDMIWYDINMIWYDMIWYDTISCVDDVTILWIIRTQPDVWVTKCHVFKFCLFLENLHVTRTVTVHCYQISIKRALIIHRSVFKTFTKQMRKATFSFAMLFVHPSVPLFLSVSME